MTNDAGWYKELTAGFEKDPEYWVEHLKLVFGEEVGRLMDERGMNQADLARELGTSRAYVTRLFHGTFNPTVLTLARVALALDARMSVHLHSREATSVWLDLTQPPRADRDVEIWADREVETVKLDTTRRVTSECATAS